jgi:tRNA pseudouridine32 synthase / 23S rRNA pseudouridine746 synthase
MRIGRIACHGFAIADKFRQSACMPPILFRDARFVVLNKPAGLTVHPGPRGGASVEDCFPLLSRRKDGPWLVHRLDADTSGCLVIALRRAALLAAQAEFAAGRVRKTYWAVVHGTPAADAGTVDAALVRRTSRAGWRMVVDPAGRSAVTDWRVLGSKGDIAWLELSPRTGRTHQVRVHCALLGCPVLGDAIYGGGPDRLHLLARAVALDLEPPVTASAEPPEHMSTALSRCGWSPHL